MRVEIGQLRRDIEATWIGHGVPVDEARIGTEMCLDAELRGHRSHGVRLSERARRVRRGGGRCVTLINPSRGCISRFTMA